MFQAPATGVDVAGFVQAAGAASLFAKMVVDGVKVATDLPRWAPVLLALIAALGGEFLLLLGQGAMFTTQLYAQATMIGIFAWGLAIGVTALQTKANKTDEKIDAALKAGPGVTRTDIDDQVKGK